VTRSVVVTNRGAPRRPASNVRKRKRRAARRVGVVRRESVTRLTPAPAGDAGARRLATPTAVRRDGLPRAAGAPAFVRQRKLGLPSVGPCVGGAAQAVRAAPPPVRTRGGAAGAGPCQAAYRRRYQSIVRLTAVRYGVGSNGLQMVLARGSVSLARLGSGWCVVWSGCRRRRGRDDDPGPGRSARSPSRPLNLMVFAPVRADALP
jgi:hypothetical protein